MFIVGCVAWARYFHPFLSLEIWLLTKMVNQFLQWNRFERLVRKQLSWNSTVFKKHGNIHFWLFFHLVSFIKIPLFSETFSDFLTVASSDDSTLTPSEDGFIAAEDKGHSGLSLFYLDFGVKVGQNGRSFVKFPHILRMLIWLEHAMGQSLPHILQMIWNL